MAKDFRRGTSAPPSSKRKQSRSCVLWLIMGVGVGVAASSLLSSRQSAPAQPSEKSTQSAHPERLLPVRPRFKFDEILNESEVEISKTQPPPPAPRPQLPAEPPKAESPKQAEARTTRKMPDPPALPAPPPTVPDTAAPRGGNYVLQMGSFGRAADAERMKAELALVGVSASVQAATLPNGRTTYRVRTGAYASRQDAEKARSLLRNRGKDSIAIPLR